MKQSANDLSWPDAADQRKSSVMSAEEATTELPRGEQVIANPRAAFVIEWAARTAIVAIFTAMAVLNLAGIYQIIPLDRPEKLLMVAARLANFMFLILIAATVLTRLSPILKAKGIEPRVSALLGTFLCAGLALLPKTELGPVFSITSTLLIMTGAMSSFIVLRWLGKSFSILAEARRLVTSGPYKVVRHPLYLCEGIAVLGVALQVISPLAVAILLIVALLQFRRMINEEAVLNSAFPEYRAYAARTPRVAPALLAAYYSMSNCGKDDPQAS
jgi:protein-S-isoprenylcysteine O-methyltransferase Ste14